MQVLNMQGECISCLAFLQLASLAAERESLAQQNAALAAALGDRLAGAAAASEAASPHNLLAQQPQPSQQDQLGQQPQPQVQPHANQQAVSPAQLRELGALLQRLTKENAALIKDR